MKKLLCIVLVFALMAAYAASLAEEAAAQAEPLPVKALLLPKFEIGEMTGDFPGEAQDSCRTVSVAGRKESRKANLHCSVMVVARRV